MPPLNEPVTGACWVPTMQSLHDQSVIQVPVMLPELSVARSAAQMKLTGAPQPVMTAVEPVEP